jgi:hypothetical protein
MIDRVSFRLLLLSVAFEMVYDIAYIMVELDVSCYHFSLKYAELTVTVGLPLWQWALRLKLVLYDRSDDFVSPASSIQEPG